AVRVLDYPVERGIRGDDDLSHVGSPSCLMVPAVDTPRHHETGRPRAAQFVPRPVYVHDGDATRHRKRVAGAMPVRSDLITKARAGDGDAFRELTEPHRRELQVHCYRMLGSFADAEDALQDTLLAAWQGIGGYAEE